MKTCSFENVEITDGFLARMQRQNREVTIRAIYDRFCETGRFGAFGMRWKEGDADKPHYFWDSDVAKWIEGAAYILQKHRNPKLEKEIEAVIDDIEKNQDPDGYFNIYFTVVEPQARFTNRDCHELYCAGHLFEAAVAYARATGRERFLNCMKKYADHIYDVFVVQKSAAFKTPGHEEIELALVKLYHYTGEKKYLDLAVHFINSRGRYPQENTEYNQSHLPVREQREAVGHAVRAVYLYTAMADLAKELQDPALDAACEALYHDIADRKMYVTGGIGSFCVGETFTNAYDLPNEEAYTETCAGIGLMFFCLRMLNLHSRAAYADTIERALYNGVLSGLSLDGKSFFYENPLEITLADHFTNSYGSRRFPITQRVACFACSCCPPNLSRLLPKLGEYLYGLEGDTLYVNQFAASTLSENGVTCTMTTDYPNDGAVRLCVQGVKKVAVRIPSWCEAYEIDRPYTLSEGYAVIDGCGEMNVRFNTAPFAVQSDSRVWKDVGRLCVQAGPIVYCAEGVDNGENLHAYAIEPGFAYSVHYEQAYGLNVIEADAWRLKTADRALYSHAQPGQSCWEPAKLTLIPYRCFANRGESDMLTWFWAKRV